MTSCSEQLIVALDLSSSAEAQRIVAALGDSVQIYKVGMQLFTAEGPAIVRDLVTSGKKVFLDLKYHDIPNTVASAVKEAARLGVSMLTVQGSGGSNMLRAASDAAKAANPQLIVLSVSVLTSMSEEELTEVGVQTSVVDQAVTLSRLALAAGCKGVVASAKEAPALRNALGNTFALITPGVRLAGAETHDQARVVTPAQAIAAGASHIVVGRPITGASSPASAVREILAELREVPVHTR